MRNSSDVKVSVVRDDTARPVDGNSGVAAIVKAGVAARTLSAPSIRPDKAKNQLKIPQYFPMSPETRNAAFPEVDVRPGKTAPQLAIYDISNSYLPGSISLIQMLLTFDARLAAMPKGQPFKSSFSTAKMRTFI